MGHERDVAGLLRLLNDGLAAGSAGRHWDAFVERIHGLIAGAVVRALRQLGVTPTRELIDDLVQDTYVRLCADELAALKRFRGGRPEALVAYLRAVAFNITRDHVRASIADKRGSGRVDAPGDEALAQATAVESETQIRDRDVLIHQIDRWLLSQTDATRGRDRWIFWLYYRHGLTTRAIAQIPAVGLSQKGVESTIYRLTKLVRDTFGAPGFAPEGINVGNTSR